MYTNLLTGFDFFTKLPERGQKFVQVECFFVLTEVLRQASGLLPYPLYHILGFFQVRVGFLQIKITVSSLNQENQSRVRENNLKFHV